VHDESENEPNPKSEGKVIETLPAPVMGCPSIITAVYDVYTAI
jgi:hypothetical protein